MTQRYGTMVAAMVCLAASACGYSEGKFKDDYLGAYCDANVACAADGGTGIFFEDAAECETFLGAFFGLGTTGCDYDAGAAKACVEAIEAADCDGLNTITDCNDVYSGDTCGWGTTTTTTTTMSM